MLITSNDSDSRISHVSIDATSMFQSVPVWPGEDQGVGRLFSILPHHPGRELQRRPRLLGWLGTNGIRRHGMQVCQRHNNEEEKLQQGDQGWLVKDGNPAKAWPIVL